MITIKIHGGLGNQMFQYAFGAALAKRRNTELALDISEYEDRSDREYQLDAFVAPAHIIPIVDFSALGLPPVGDAFFLRLRRRLFRTYQSWLPLQYKTYISEPHFNFSPEVFTARNGIYFAGYWQSSKYFTNTAADIRRAFALHSPLSAQAAAVAQQIAKDAEHSTPVSVHIRRGDYVSKKNVNAFNGTCPPEYYRDAIKYLEQRGVKNPIFYVFSDDIGWVQKNLPFLSPAVFVSQPTISAPEDITLMSLCTHHIIANSTFSWWGAWLDPKPAKIVIAPKRWFKDETVDTSDVVPPEWIQI